jgi:hypothetical protein
VWDRTIENGDEATGKLSLFFKSKYIKKNKIVIRLYIWDIDERRERGEESWQNFGDSKKEKMMGAIYTYAIFMT